MFQRSMNVHVIWCSAVLYACLFLAVVETQQLTTTECCVATPRGQPLVNGIVGHFHDWDSRELEMDRLRVTVGEWFLHDMNIYIARVICQGHHEIAGQSYCVDSFDDAFRHDDLRQARLLWLGQQTRDRALKLGALGENHDQQMPLTYYDDCGSYSASNLAYFPDLRCKCGATLQYKYDVRTDKFCALATDECGTVTPHGEILVVHGLPSKLGVFPWHIGVYRKNWNGSYEQICGGSLISSNLVVSAAHCFYEENGRRLYNASEFITAAGKYYRAYDHGNDTYVQKSVVREINVPERYLGYRGAFANDIALVRLETPFSINALVKPVCVDWNNTYESVQLRDRQMGKVLGWGRIVTGESSDELKEINLPFISYQKCLEEVPDDFRPMISPTDKFCAGYLNGSSVCHGDSGGGLCFESNEHWYLRGIVSSIPTGSTDLPCNNNMYATFTHVGHHLNWIRTASDNFQEIPGLEPSRASQCGRAVDNATLLAIDGSTVEYNDFPWDAKIEQRVSGRLPDVCTGALISTDLVLTTSQSLFDSNDLLTYDKSTLVVTAGRYYDIEKFAAHRGQESSVKEITKSPHGPIALIRLMTPFVTTKLVSPVCLDWNNRFAKQQLWEGHFGLNTYPRWTATSDITYYDEANLADIRNQLCHSGASVRKNHVAWADFCAQTTDNRINNRYYDAGTGICFQFDGFWYLRGVKSLGFRTPYGTFDMYSNMENYLEWIQAAYSGSAA